MAFAWARLGLRHRALQLSNQKTTAAEPSTSTLKHGSQHSLQGSVRRTLSIHHILVFHLDHPFTSISTPSPPPPYLQLNMAWNDDLLLKVANIASYALFTSGNVYAQLQGTVVSETYLTPSRWIFGVWPFIHFLFLGMIIYQFTEAGSAHVVRGIGWRFPLLCILNAAYSGLSSAQLNAHHDRVYAIVAFVVMLLIAATVSHCYRSLKVHHTASNLADTAVVHLPFSLYHGFVVVLLFVSGFEAFGVNANTHKAGIITKIVVFLSLLFLESTAAGYVWYSEGDVAGAAVISLSLLAIFQHQTSSKFIHWSALAFFIISLVAVLRAVIAIFTNRNTTAISDEERAPLVG